MENKLFVKYTDTLDELFNQQGISSDFFQTFDDNFIQRLADLSDFLSIEDWSSNLKLD